MKRKMGSSWTSSLMIVCALSGCAARRAPAPAAATPAFSREARRELAYTSVREKRWSDAIALLGALLDEEPDDSRLRMELGYARHAAGDGRAATDEFELVARRQDEFAAQAESALRQIAAESTPESRAARTVGLLDEGYGSLRRGERGVARAKFEEALAHEPGRTEIVKQLAYMSIEDGQLHDAVQELSGARTLSPQDHLTALELGYAYDRLENHDAAEKSFVAALPSSDPRVRAAAESALKNVRARSAPLYLDLYASPYHTSRFSDSVAFFEARAGYKPPELGPLSFFLASRYTQDTRSRSGAVPEIYSDNFFSIAPGIRLQPRGRSVSLSAEWGATFNLLRSDEYPDAAESGGRVVLADYRYWAVSRRIFADAGAAVGYYSRYRDNIIGAFQARVGATPWPGGETSPALRIYSPLNIVMDSNKDFYNNAVELGAGLELQPWARLNLKLRGEFLRGTYMGRNGRDPNPYGRHYSDVRVMLVYAAHFTRSVEPKALEPMRKGGFRW